jgi:hypothetical protein
LLKTAELPMQAAAFWEVAQLDGLCP